jgi:flagellar assembly factor FliW
MGMKMITNFPSGMPRVENVKKYTLLGSGKRCIVFLASKHDDPNLAFVVTDPFVIQPDYFVRWMIRNEDFKARYEDVLSLAIVTGLKTYAYIPNLKAPF